ncbi:MAG: helix-turn-helix transcriptional regulator [Merdibacter sp.]
MLNIPHPAGHIRSAGETIKQVADQCGFHRAVTQIFRKFVGMSPKEYRSVHPVSEKEGWQDALSIGVIPV